MKTSSHESRLWQGSCQRC